MQIGLIGLPQSGKKTLLRLLTGVDAAHQAGAVGEVVPGVCQVQDPRLKRLASMYNPAKVSPATIQYMLMPDLTKDSKKNQELLQALLAVDVLAVVIRAFPNDAVFHLEGSVDPLRDINTALCELILNDLLFVEKRLERIAKEQTRRGGVDRSQEQIILCKLQAHLNDGLPLRTLALDAEESKRLSGAPLLTRKPLLIIVNIGDEQIRDRQLLDEIRGRYEKERVRLVQISVKIEDELAQLDDASSRQAFLDELGIAEPAIDHLSRVSYETLGLISYFTVGTDEVRAWTIRSGASAAEAGGVIHSDIERGFIRVELIKYDDLISLGSEQNVAAAGKVFLKGKDYIVEDGDILSFRFNV